MQALLGTGPTIYFAQLPWPDRAVSRAARRKGRETLAAALVAAGREPPETRDDPGLAGLENTKPWRLSRNVAGRNLIAYADGTELSVSFSHQWGMGCPFRSWAALASEPHWVGIDAVGIEEFAHPYPYYRAFSEEELDALVRFRKSSSTPELAAELWAVKEAAVKACGTGFRNLDPVDVQVRCHAHPCFGQRFSLHLPNNRRHGFAHPRHHGTVSVVTSRRGESFIAIAWTAVSTRSGPVDAVLREAVLCESS